MRYREVLPPAPLASVVQSLWEVRADRGSGAPCVLPVMPDGCFDLVFHLGARPQADRLDPSRSRARTLVVGALLRAVRIELAGDVHIVGVCLRPGAVRSFLEAAACELTDRIVPLEEVWGGKARALEDAVRDGNPDGVLDRLARALRERLPRATPPDPLSQRAVDRIRSAGGAVSVGALARDLGVARRRLERRFAANVGLTPKQFCRVTRFDGVVRRAPRGTSWTQRALAHGYHDQAHLIHEFRALAGVTPLDFEREQRASARDPGAVANGQYGGPAAR